MNSRFPDFGYNGGGGLASYLGQFTGVRVTASNICFGCAGDYTIEDFQKTFPQFFKKDDTTDPPTYTPLVPEGMLQIFVDIANVSIQKCRWHERWPLAIALFVAHYATLYLRTYSDGSETPEDGASSGTIAGVLASAKLGDSSVTYDVASVVSATETWGAWNSTQYGLQLVTEARYVAMGGMFVI